MTLGWGACCCCREEGAARGARRGVASGEGKSRYSSKLLQGAAPPGVMGEDGITSVAAMMAMLLWMR